MAGKGNLPEEIFRDYNRRVYQNPHPKPWGLEPESMRMAQRKTEPGCPQPTNPVQLIRYRQEPQWSLSVYRKLQP